MTHTRSICELVTELAELLTTLRRPRAAEVRALAASCREPPEESWWREINRNSWWAGAGSLAASTLDPQLTTSGPDAIWAQQRVRDLLAEIGQSLIRRGNENPGVSSWLSVFHTDSTAGQ